jgi:hypothetical protein
VERAEGPALVGDLEAPLRAHRLFAFRRQNLAEQIAEGVVWSRRDRESLRDAESEHLGLAIGAHPQFVRGLLLYDREKAVDPCHSSPSFPVIRQSE